MIWQACAPDVANSDSCAARLREHMLAHLICPGRHTLSGLITTCGQQFKDWTAHYALYAKDRVHGNGV